MKKFSVAMLAVIVVAAIPALAATKYFQDFETSTADWTGVTQVPTGTNGVTSAAGSSHAQAANSAYTRFLAYESTFPAGGYTTAIDVYLDLEANYANDTRFDWSSAINGPDGNHRRDFVFNAGFYNDSDLTGSGPRFVISASNNAGRSGAYPRNPGRYPFSITKTGWYTFEHRFKKMATGVLAVELTISTLDGATVKTWTLSDSTDVVAATVGGHRYGWFINEVPALAIDNASLLSVVMAGSVSACKNDGWKDFMRADGSIFTNQGDCVQYVNTAK